MASFFQVQWKRWYQHSHFELFSEKNIIYIAEREIKRLRKQASLRFSSETSVWSLRHMNNATNEVLIGIPTRCCKTCQLTIANMLSIKNWSKWVIDVYRKVKNVSSMSCRKQINAWWDDDTWFVLHLLSLIFIVLAHYNNRPSVVPHVHHN